MIEAAYLHAGRPHAFGQRLKRRTMNYVSIIAETLVLTGDHDVSQRKLVLT